MNLPLIYQKKFWIICGQLVVINVQSNAKIVRSVAKIRIMSAHRLFDYLLFDYLVFDNLLFDNLGGMLCGLETAPP